jgi:hypothetical protein
LHLIFARLNKASVPLASHELRQAIFPGPLTNYVNRVSGESEQLLRARRLKKPDFRLRDAETLLRYIGLKTNLPKYSGDLRDFLDRTLKGGNDHFAEIERDLDHTVEEMEAAISTVFDIFGDRAFLRFNGDRNKYVPRFNVAVFDLMTWYFSDAAVRAASATKQEDIVTAFEWLCSSDPEFVGYLTATTKSPEAMHGRISRWGVTLGEVIQRDLYVTEFVDSFLPIAAPARQ